MLTLIAAIALHAPTAQETNVYAISERLSNSQFGTVLMIGTETRTIGRPIGGQRRTAIVFEVKIAEKSLRGKDGERWAQAELSDLRAPDNGILDDRDRFVESEGVAADAFPILPRGMVEIGARWTEIINHVRCQYTLQIADAGRAVIATTSEEQMRVGKLKRSGRWTLEIESGRLLKWNLHSEVILPKGSREMVDSSGELKA